MTHESVQSYSPADVGHHTYVPDRGWHVRFQRTGVAAQNCNVDGGVRYGGPSNSHGIESLLDGSA